MASKNYRLTPRATTALRALEVMLARHHYSLIDSSSAPQVLGCDMHFEELSGGLRVFCHKLLLCSVNKMTRELEVFIDRDYSATVILTRHRCPDLIYYTVEKVETCCTCRFCDGGGGNGYHFVEDGGICPTCKNTGQEHIVLTNERGGFNPIICMECFDRKYTPWWMDKGRPINPITEGYCRCSTCNPYPAGDRLP